MKTLDQTIYHMDIRVILSKLGASIFLYFAPIAPLIHATLALLLIDLLTGFWKSKIVKRRITSHRLQKTTHKTGGYLLAIITAQIVDASYLNSSIHLPQIVSAYIGFTELTSIYENISEITGTKFLNDIVKDITKRIKEQLKNKNDA